MACVWSKQLPTRKILRHVAHLSFVLLAWLAFQSEAHAQIANRQGEVPRYEPQRPTVSPYLNLLRRDGGALTNYQGLVRPMQRQSSINRQNAEALRRQQVSLVELGNQATDRQRVAEIRQTGSEASFLNYSHFFPQISQHGRAR
jgi:hypothetical protein